MDVHAPYLVFLANAHDRGQDGLRPGRLVPRTSAGQCRMDGCVADLGVRELSPEQAAAEGARTL